VTGSNMKKIAINMSTMNFVLFFCAHISLPDYGSIRHQILRLKTTRPNLIYRVFRTGTGRERTEAVKSVVRSEEP
jgi:hypothetical protein